MRLTLGVAIAGLVLITAGFLVDQATHIPCVLRIIAPQYVGANKAAETLFTRNTLNRSESGFDDLAELYISQLPKQPPPDLFPVSFIREANVATLTNDGLVIVVRMKWTDGQETTWDQQHIEKSLDSLLDSSLTVWKFVLFPLGLLVECLAIFFEYYPYKTPE